MIYFWVYNIFRIILFLFILLIQFPMMLMVYHHHLWNFSSKWLKMLWHHQNVIIHQ